jgi:hypothetical protein
MLTGLAQRLDLVLGRQQLLAVRQHRVLQSLALASAAQAFGAGHGSFAQWFAWQRKLLFRFNRYETELSGVVSSPGGRAACSICGLFVPSAQIWRVRTSFWQTITSATKDVALSSQFESCWLLGAQMSDRQIMRIFGIWLFGLLAGAIAGGIVGAWLDTGYEHTGWFFGMFAGLFGFACVRLWLGQNPKIST